MRWRMLLLLFLARIGLGFQFQTLGSVSDDLIEDVGLDYAEVGALIGVFMVPGLFLALPAGFAGRYFSDRAIAVFSLVAMAFGSVVSGMADDIWTIGAGRVLAGAGFVFSTLYFTKMTTEWFAGREIATAMSVLVMSWPFGIAMGQIGHEWLAGITNWRWPFYTTSVYCALAALALLLLYRPPAPTDAVKVSRGIGLSGHELKLILLAGVAWGVFNAGYVTYLAFAPLMLEAQGQTAFKAAAIVSVGSWIMIVSGVVCGQIVDRTGRPDIVLTLCMIGAAAALALLTVNGGGLLASLLFGLVGMAPAGVIIALSGKAMRPDRRALGMGLFFTVYYAFMATGPLLSGWIYETTSRPFAPILFGILLFAAVVPVNFLFQKVKANEAAVDGSTLAARPAVSI